MHFKVKARKGGGWSLRFYKDGSYQYVTQDKWPGGLRAEMPIEEARGVVKSLNAEFKIMAQEAKRLGASNRLLSDEERKCAWLPDDVMAHFESVFIRPAESSPGYGKLLGIWKYVRKMIVGVNMDPSLWSLSPTPFYKWMAEHPRSLDYVTRCLRLLRNYGYTFCLIRKKPFNPIPKMPDLYRTQISDALEELGRDRKSDAITAEQILELRTKIADSEYRWVAIAWSFGLRPEEVDLLHVKETNGRLNWWTEQDDTILVVDQPKLKKVKRKLRYKRIPVFTAWQREAMSFIMSGDFTRPDVKGVRKAFPEGVTLYGCRHGFTRFMEQMGQPMDKVSKWLGHRSIKTTEKYYRDHGLLAPVDDVDDEAA